MLKTRIKALILATCAFAVVTPAALAADDTSVTVTGGTLSMTNPTAANFAGVTFSTTSQTDTAALDTFNATDLRGDATAGWKINAQATQFSDGDATAPKTLPASSLRMSQPTVSAVGTTTSTNPAVQTGPYTLDGASPVKIASAAAGTGMGEYNFTATTLTVTVPGYQAPATYTSTVTVSVETGP